jgi:hypothetical protein
VVAVVQGLLRPGYSFMADPVVALVAGPSGWVQDLNFVVLGAAMIAVLSRPMAADPSWRRLGGYALTTGIAILVVIPIHSVLAFPADGPLHPWWGLFNWSAMPAWTGPASVRCGDVAALAEVVHPNIVHHDGPPGAPQGLDGMGFEHWAVPDNLDLARQLGAIPRPPSQPVFADALGQLLSDLHP